MLDGRNQNTKTSTVRIVSPERTIFRLFRCIVSCASGEFLLTRCRWPNGGAVIFVRSVWIAACVCLLALAFYNGVDPERTFSFDCTVLRKQFRDGLQWFAAFFAGGYTALYARFASQWTYLANAYHMIKQYECSRTNARAEDADTKPRTRLAEWKAAFVEDAENLHLATKPEFASAIWYWCQKSGVQKVYEKSVPHGPTRFQELLARVERALLERDPQWLARNADSASTTNRVAAD